MRTSRTLLLVAAVAIALVSAPGSGRAHAAAVAVRYPEGVSRGFLALKSPAGEVLADGDLLQVVRLEGVESRLVFRFRDGSLHDETVFFSQLRAFALLSYRLLQRGPTFPEELDVSVERGSDRYRVRAKRPGAAEQVSEGTFALPPDVYNGMLIMLLRNLARGTGQTVHVLAFTPKPLLVPLELTPLREETVLAGERRVAAVHYALRPKLGLVRSTVAALLGRTPADYHCWIATEGPPAFVAIDGPLYSGGPTWRIETVSPREPGRAAASR